MADRDNFDNLDSSAAGCDSGGSDRVELNPSDDVVRNGKRGRPTIGRNVADENAQLTRRQRFAALLIAQGKSFTKVAQNDNVHCTVPTIRKWMEDPKFYSLVVSEQDQLVSSARSELIGKYVAGAKKAFMVLYKQLDAKEIYAAQNAAVQLINKFHQYADKEDEKSVQVVFSGMPTVGSPNQNDTVAPVDAIPPVGDDLINQMLKK